MGWDLIFWTSLLRRLFCVKAPMGKAVVHNLINLFFFNVLFPKRGVSLKEDYERGRTSFSQTSTCAGKEDLSGTVPNVETPKLILWSVILIYLMEPHFVYANYAPFTWKLGENLEKMWTTKDHIFASLEFFWVFLRVGKIQQLKHWFQVTA